MEYQQITLTEWAGMKREIEQDLRDVKMAFVRIGYNLRRIDERQMYHQDGYKTIFEFAKAEYNLGKSTTSRLMAINRRFSIGGYSKLLDPQYKHFKSSSLEEMLALPDSDLEMIEPGTSRETIRELKRFNKEAKAEEEQAQSSGDIVDVPGMPKPQEAPEAQEATVLPASDSAIGSGAETVAPAQQKEHPDGPAEENAAETQQKEPECCENAAELTQLQRMICRFFKDFPEALNNLVRAGFPEYSEKLKDIVNPSGSTSVRNGAWIMIMNEGEVKLKRFGGKPEAVSWTEFFGEAEKLYQMGALGKKVEDESDKEVDERAAGDSEDRAVEGTSGSAQGTAENAERRPEAVGGDTGEHGDTDQKEIPPGGGNEDAEKADGRDPDAAGGTEAGAAEIQGRPAGESEVQDGEKTVAPAQQNEPEQAGVPDKMSPEEKAKRYAQKIAIETQNEEWEAARHHLNFLEAQLDEILQKIEGTALDISRRYI